MCGSLTRKGNYKKISLQKLSKLLAFRSVRVGSYGDPAVIPSEVWDKMLSRTLGNTGYTHQWQKCDNNNSRFNMASVDSLEEKRQANKLGYRTFRTRLASEPIESDEVICPSDKVARKGRKLVPCADCMMCSGTSSKVKKTLLSLFINHNKENKMTTEYTIYNEDNELVARGNLLEILQLLTNLGYRIEENINDKIYLENQDQKKIPMLLIN